MVYELSILQYTTKVQLSRAMMHFHMYCFISFIDSLNFYYYTFTAYYREALLVGVTKLEEMQTIP